MVSFVVECVVSGRRGLDESVRLGGRGGLMGSLGSLLLLDEGVGL